MDIVGFIGLSLALGALALLGWHAWRLIRRGHCDHRWVLEEAHHAALFLALVLGANSLGRFLTVGLTSETAFWLTAAALFVPAPYLLYASGRVAGMWQRSRETIGQYLAD